MNEKTSRFRKFIKKVDYSIQNQEIQLSGYAVIVGVIGGLGAVVFRVFITFLSYLFFQLPTRFHEFPLVITVLSPAIGGLLVGTLIYYFAPEAKGHGVPEIVYAVNKEGGKMRLRVPFVKILASALTIGSGGSAGREGPIAQIGGGFGSLFAQELGLSEENTKVLVMAGVAAGISATFNAPLGGVLFSIELIRRDKKAFSFIPLVISSVVGTTIGEFFLGKSPAFLFPTSLNISVQQIIRGFPVFIMVGVITGLYGVFWVNGFYFIEDILEKIPVHPIALVGIGGTLVGIIEVWFPEVNGQTYEPIDKAFFFEYSLQLALLLLLFKFLATSLSIGSGGSGGVFAPSLLQGAFIGLAIGFVFHHFGYTILPLSLYVLLGMAGVFAASAKAPLTAIVILSEMTNDYYLFIPLMFCVVTAWVLSELLLKGKDIYTIKLERRGIRFYPSIDVLEEVTVEQVMITNPITVNPKDRLETIMELMHQTKHTGFPVVENERIIGIITEHDVNEAILNKPMKEWIVDNVCKKKIYFVLPTHPLAKVMLEMTEHKINRLPVVEDENSFKLIGWVTRSDIMNAYRKHKAYLVQHETEELIFKDLSKAMEK